MYNQKFNYTKLTRETVNGKRHYCTPDGKKLASVTTILDKTKPEEKVKALQEWRNRVGHEKAQQITTEAAGRGTSMHTFLELFLKGTPKAPGTNLVHQASYPMAQKIITEGLVHLNECWGTEVPVWYPELYAGSTDGAGLWKGKPAIFDFKQTNKPKKREWIDDYFIQLVFYGTAHNKLHGTDINTGVIMMCSKDYQYQEFVIEGEEWIHYENEMWNRIEQFYIQLYK